MSKLPNNTPSRGNGESKFNFAYVISIVVLLFFSYITFLGLAYHYNGELTMPIVLTVCMILVVAGCIYLISVCRSTRWDKLGVPGQICFGVIVLGVLLVASLPFTNFLQVSRERKELSALMIAAGESASAMDAEYTKYVDARITNYKSDLRKISTIKSSNPAQYKLAYGNATGNSDSEKAEMLAASLREKLLPASAQEIINDRHEWISQAENLNVWNLMTPTNIGNFQKKMNEWQTQYADLSKLSFAGETQNAPFSYTSFDTQLNSLIQTYETYHKPNAIAIGAAILCFLFMLMPYFISQKSIASKETKSSQMYE